MNCYPWNIPCHGWIKKQMVLKMNHITCGWSLEESVVSITNISKDKSGHMRMIPCIAIFYRIGKKNIPQIEDFGWMVNSYTCKTPINLTVSKHHGFHFKCPNKTNPCQPHHFRWNPSSFWGIHGASKVCRWWKAQRDMTCAEADFVSENHWEKLGFPWVN